MCTWKSSITGGAVDSKRTESRPPKVLPHKVDETTGSMSRRLQKVESKALEIAPDYAADCDPYISTGQYCVLNLDR